MNTKLSGAQMVLVPITQQGKNKFPFVENINHRVVKYIDFYPVQYLPGTSATGTTSTANMFLTLVGENGSTRLHNNLPLERVNYQQTLGSRLTVCEKLSLDDCFVECRNAQMVGTVAAFVLWYDLPEFSARNTADRVITDSVAIPLTNVLRYNMLTDEERMAGKRFRRILLGSPTLTPDFQTGVAYADLANLYITLCRGSYLVCENVPLMLLYQIATLWKSEFANIVFDFQSSYITIGGAGTIPGATTKYIGKSVFLNLQYENK